jgi:hypothetical protein
MRKPSKESIARSCLIAYLVLLCVSPMILGDNGVWLIVSGLALVPPIILGSLKQRVVTSVFVAFTILFALAYCDQASRSGPHRLKARLIACEVELARLKAEAKGGAGVDPDAVGTPPE